MPVRREDGRAVVPKRKKSKPKPPTPAPISDVQAGGDNTPKRSGHTAPPSRRRVSGTPYEQLKRSGGLDKKGRQKNAGPPRKPSEKNRIVRTRDGGTKLIPLPKYRKMVRKQKRELAERKRLYANSPHRDDRLAARDPRLAPTKVAGINIDAAIADLDRRVFPKGNPGLQIAKTPIQVVRATAEDPKGVVEGTAKSLKDTVVSLPSVAVSTVKDPEGTLKELGEDYKRRYGPLLEGDTKKFRERLKEEGVLSEVADITSVASAGGQVAGAARRLARKPRPRPKLRTTGGAAKEQAVSRNAIVEVMQRGEDTARRRVQNRRAKKAVKRETPVDALVSTAIRREGEVAPIRLRRARRKQQRAVARGKGRNLQAMKVEQATEVHRGSAREVARLSRKERLGLKYAVQLGVRDAKTARPVLKKRLEAIKAARAESGKKVPRVLRATNDEVRAIEAILREPDKVFTPRLAQVADAQKERSGRLSVSDPTLAPEQTLMRRYAPVAEQLGIKRTEGEPVREFVTRVREKAKAEGLATPGYFPSQKRPTARYADYAVGGVRAATGDKAYTGALFRTGREDITPQPMLDAQARNIKRKHNWKHVQDTANEHAFQWGRNKSLAELRDELDSRGVDPSSVGFWNPGKFQDQRTLREQLDADNPELGLTDNALGEEPSVAGLDRAVDDATLTGEDAMALVDSRGGEKGWSIIPKGVYDEIHADTRPSGAFGRSLDVAKGKQSRILLGAGNVPWLQFQVASNALLTGLAKTGPVDFVKAQVWWKKLDPELKNSVQPWVGIGPFQGDIQQTKLGAAANNRFVNGYRAFKQTPMARRAGKLNPLDALFRVDNAQNNMFRRSVLYSQAKRDAYRRMGQNVGRTMEAQKRLTGLFTLGPRKQIDEILRNKNLIEKHAQYVNEWLGDYATYTARERRWLARNVMFYGFLRFSLNFAFYTMPRKHPIMSSLFTNLGQIQAEEVRTLLGGDELPFSFGKLYFTEDGKLEEVNLGRMNPATNTLTEALAPGENETTFIPRRLLNMLPPAFSAALDLAYGKSAFSGKDLKVKGENRYDAAFREDPLALEEMGRIAAARGLKLFYPYRLAEDLTFDGEPMGDDALLWDPRPTQYKKGGETDRSIRRGVRQTEARGDSQRLVEELVPLIPRPSRDREVARSIRERRKGQTSKTSGDSSSGGSGWDKYRDGAAPKQKSGWDAYR